MNRLTRNTLFDYNKIGEFSTDSDATHILDDLNVEQMDEMLAHVTATIDTFYRMMAMNVEFDREHARSEVQHALNVRHHIEHYMLMGLI